MESTPTFQADPKLTGAAPLFAALGDPSRLRIVSRLCDEGPLSISKLTEGAMISRQAVTKHLHALADAELVASERRGRERVWELQPRRLAEAREHLAGISQRWDDAMGRLQAYVERPEEP